MNKLIHCTLLLTLLISTSKGVSYPRYPMLGSKCSNDANCTGDGWESCDKISKTCIQKEIFPMFGLEYIGNICVIFLIFYSNIGGLGGGGLLIPTCIIFYNFDTKNSIMMSNISILASALYRYLKNFNKKNPENGWGTCVDYSTTLIMLPAVIIGSTIGTFINIMVPEIVLDIGIVIFLTYLIASITVKLVQICKQEKQIFDKQKMEKKALFSTDNNLQGKEICVGPTDKEEKEEKVCDVQTNRDERQKENPLASEEEEVRLDFKKDEDQDNLDDKNLSPSTGTIIGKQEKNQRTKEQEELLKKIIARESSNIKQGSYIIQNLIMMAALVIIQCIRGKGDGSGSKVVKCSATDWFLFALLLAIALVLTILGIYQVKNEFKLKVKAGYVFIEGSLQYSTWVIFKCEFAAFIAGFLNGALGIGTGMILNPFLIQIGLCSFVASSSGMYLVIYGLTANTIIQIVLGKLNGPYALNFVILTLIGSAPGILAQNYFLAKYKRQSIIVAVLITVILYTVVLVAIFQFNILTHKQLDGINIWATQGYCPSLPASNVSIHSNSSKLIFL